MVISVNITMAEGDTHTMTVQQVAEAIFAALMADESKDAVTVQIVSPPVSAVVPPPEQLQITE